MSNNAYGDLIVKAVSDYVVTGNTMATGMSYHHSSNGIVEDNRFVRPDGTDAGNRIAIAAGSTSEYCFNNTVRNNYIENFNVGISVTGEGNTIEDNTIINSQGSGIRLIYPVTVPLAAIRPPVMYTPLTGCTPSLPVAITRPYPTILSPVTARHWRWPTSRTSIRSGSH